MAVGVLFLKPGENDTQEPHDSDEIYYILDGNGFLEFHFRLDYSKFHQNHVVIVYHSHQVLKKERLLPRILY